MDCLEDVNGCGSKSTEWIPDATMTPFCNAHDRDYNTGGSEWDRLIYDQVFRMQIRIYIWCWTPSLLRSVTLYMSDMAYAMIRKFGSEGFNYNFTGVDPKFNTTVKNYDILVNNPDYWEDVKEV